MSVTRPVRWGILGLANITRRFIPAVRQASNAHLVAVATRRPEAAAKWLVDQPDLRVETTYEALLADPSIEAIYLPLPNTLHADWAIQAAAAGKHVLCEKPLATSLADVERMVVAAERHSTLLMEGFMWRFHPQHIRLRELINADAIGQPRLVRAGLSFLLARDPANIRLNAELGGGAIWDVGCYAISIPRFLFGAEPVTISATARIDSVFNVDLALAALVTFPDNRTALLDASMEAVRRSGYEIIGTTGRLRIEQFWAEPEAATRIIMTAADGSETVETLPPANHFIAEIEHFSAAVRGQTPLRYGAADALGQIRALEAMQRSFRSARAERP